jgi:hypothetical protein
MEADSLSFTLDGCVPLQDQLLRDAHRVGSGQKAYPREEIPAHEFTD